MTAIAPFIKRNARRASAHASTSSTKRLSGILMKALSFVLLAAGAGRHATIAFGPWMILGAAAGVGVGEPFWAWYVGLLV